MIRKTLGGDRLGSGNNMKVNLEGYRRSTHDLSYVFKSTMAPGTLVPFINDILLPGDTHDIDLTTHILTLPTEGPLFGSYKVQADIFTVPIRLYNSLLHNNRIGIGMKMADIKLPQLSLTARPVTATEKDIDNAQVNPSCLLSYLGIRGVGIPGASTQVRDFNGTSVLAYWDIVKQYYANKQEGKGAVIHASTDPTITTVTGITVNVPGVGVVTLTANGAPSVTLQSGTLVTVSYSGTVPNLREVYVSLKYGGIVSHHDLVGGEYVVNAGTIVGTYDWMRYGPDTITGSFYGTNTLPRTVAPRVVTFDLENIDTIKEEILAFAQTTSAYNINSFGLPPYNYLHESTNSIPNILNSQEGLALKGYQSDLFNNWLNDEFVDYVSTASAVSTTGNSFTIDQLNLSKKVYDMLNRIMVSGGTYYDWLQSVYMVDPMRAQETPMYVGGLIEELVFQEVVSNSSSERQPLGTLAGRGRSSGNKKGGSVVIKVNEPSIVIGLVSLTPRLGYSQGNDWTVHLRTLDDLHKPQLDGIGFQDLITEQMAWWTTEWSGTEWVQKSAGKQPAWLNYMTNVDRIKGDFAIKNNSMFMTLNRSYQWNKDPNQGTDIADLTTYIDPQKYNNVFAMNSLDAQNFWVQIGVNWTARRLMSAQIMPNL